MKCFAAALFSLAVLSILPAAQATTWYVPSQCPTIQAGIDSAAAGDTVLVACGTYDENDIIMKSGICLRSETGQADCVTIDAEASGRVIQCTNADNTTRFEGLTLTGGSAETGGGVACVSSSPNFKNCSVSGNFAIAGAGIHCRDSSSVTVTDCSFSGNPSAGTGGGIYCTNHSNPSVSGSTFSGNSASNGAGIYCYDACTATVTNCTFTDNTCVSNGGGMHCHTCPPAVITDCVFSGNSSGYSGGAIYCYDCAASITACTLSSNSTTGAGGGCGIFAAYSSVSLATTIIAFGTHGEAVSCGLNGSVSLTCCDVYDNAAGDWVGCIAAQATENDNMSADPQFCNPPEGNFGVGPNSPCLGANNDCGLQIGAEGESCTDEEQSRVEAASWSSVKALYR